MVVFACQRDSFKREYITSVVSCQPIEIEKENGGEKTTCFEIVCEDTILFPEGGGQPYDQGEMNGVAIFKVLRRGVEAVHYSEKSFDVGTEVKQVVNWKRRFDHMQQHSGQHLLTAIADSLLNYSTTAWWLGEDISHIELDTTKLTQQEVDNLEEEVNDKIRQCLPMTADVIEENSSQLDASRTRGLPKDHVGDVRVVTISTIESNMCCGTHVSNLGQLQAIKLLNFEKGKKGKTNLLFLVGNRVLSRFDSMFRRELGLNLLLKNGPSLHASLVDKLIKSNKTTTKTLQNILKEYANLVIAQFKTVEPKPNFFYHWRKEAEMDYVNYFIKEFNNSNVLLFVVVGEKDEGHAVLHGPETIVQELGPLVAEDLDGKGNGKGLRFQAKVKNFKGLAKAIKRCQDRLSQ